MNSPDTDRIEGSGEAPRDGGKMMGAETDISLGSRNVIDLGAERQLHRQIARQNLRDALGRAILTGHTQERGLEMDELILQIMGKQSAMEVLQVTFFTHLAAHLENPNQFIAQVMANTQENLQRRQEVAADATARREADYAMLFFDEISAAMLAHVTQHGAPQGRA